MTNLQLFGMVGVIWLLDDLVRWIQLPRVPVSRRTWQLRHALVGLAGPVWCSGFWVLFTLQEGTHQGPPGPWWFITLVVIVGLAFSFRVLLELRRTIWAQREAAEQFRDGL